MLKSLIFHRENLNVPVNIAEPEYFHDLNLDQIINKIVKSKESFNLTEYFYFLSQDLESIQFRQDIMRDMEDEVLYNSIALFSKELSVLRSTLARIEKLYYPLQQQCSLLEEAHHYQQTLKNLKLHLHDLDLGSRGLQTFSDELQKLLESNFFREFESRTSVLIKKLESIRYAVVVTDNKVTVKPCLDDDDYAAEILHDWRLNETLLTVEDNGSVTGSGYDLDHVQARILEGVAQLYPEPFQELNAYCNEYMQPTAPKETKYRAQSLEVARYPFMALDILERERELQFYLAYLGYIAPLKRLGLPFSIPQLQIGKDTIQAEQTFDLALAISLMEESSRQVVVNNIDLSEGEKIFVVTGPNQGGKTTFARTFGQIHHLAGLGCPVPGKNTHLCLCDGIYTHFSYREDINAGHGKLEEDLLRLHENLKKATNSSIFILNELFDSTTYEDALYLSEQIIHKLLKKNSLTVWVTFIDALASISPSVVSLMSMVDSQDLSKRTFKICRKPADGLAYALSLAAKYGLTYAALMDKIK
ncbi:hypothetical protein B1757_14100 [Acidithiobacillus marinus]|uniref:DNA mismatch repair proteins mutS family domain-containing protein n=1 Tax=Acidithiobacillus marinus TaxID=187490 RepID=A0A2I1DIB3_9PROT|nr:DNA mismatch repair protein MutS [Acidithiobacillus marinus]PKY09613.1 hypothetical protein B1757_14100 [Acidithiobacillus marinus]